MEQELDKRREPNYGIASNWNQTQGLVLVHIHLKLNLTSVLGFKEDFSF
jgi:hypothetical protein